MSNTPGNILGNGFDPFVIEQIKIRQQKLGLIDSIPNDILEWSHKKTAWLRLASSVDSDEDGGNLAKNNILFGGTVSYSSAVFEYPGSPNNRGPLINLRSGLDTYDNSSFGYRPMATIIGADISYLNNNGTLQKAAISIKAYSPEQLEIIDKLYMRLGYSILLEWGHTIYLDNKGNKQEFNSVTNPFIKFFTAGTTQQDMYNVINSERIIYQGNYEAFYGQIIKFNWKFNAEDASYDINVEAISPGHIIESLKLNTTLKKTTGEDSESTPSTAPGIVGYRDASCFHNFLYDTYFALNPNAAPRSDEDLRRESSRRQPGGL